MILTAGMAKRSVTRTAEIPPLELRAAIAPDTLNEEKRTVDVIWTTGARVMRGFFEPYLEELSLDPKHVRMDRLNSGAAPLLNAHSSYDLSDVIGVVESASLQKARGVATVRFARAEDDPTADQIFRKVKDKIIKNVSVGYRVHKMVKVEDGEGKTPVYMAVDWEPFEISPVPIGADAGAVTRSATATTNVCEFTEERTMDPEETETEKPKESAAVAATRAAREARAEDAKARAEERAAAAEDAIAKERVRTAGIRKIAKDARMGEEWSSSLIEAGTSVDEARRLAFTEITRKDGEFEVDGSIRIGAGDDERDKWVRGGTAWLIQRTGFADVVKRGKELLPEHPAFKDLSLDPGEFRGMTPLELARQSLERNRINTRGMDAMRMAGLAFTATRNSNYQTTSDFAILLENVLGKVLLGAYATQENTWSKFCKTIEVKDFRTSNQYRTGSIPSLEAIAEHGEYHSGAIPDGAKYPVVTGRLGKKFSLSREVIVNDDMGAMMQLAEGFGQASMRTIEVSVYALLALNSGLGPTQADAQPFFNAANRANLTTGAALSVAALDLDRVALRAQKDPSSLDFLDLRPAVLLVPDSLYGQASVINDSQYDTDKIANGRMQEPNRVRGLFREVVGTPRFTGTRRYIFANTMDAIVVAFLQGYGRAPTIETMNGWNIDGVEWKVTMYAKAQMGDPKSALTNAGV